MSRKEVKVKLGLVTAITATVFSLGACGGTETAEQQPSQSVQTEVSVEPATDPVEAEHISDMGDVESADTEPEEFSVTADEIYILTDLQSASHQQIPREEILALALSFNWDYISDEDKDIILDKYAMSLEDLDYHFRAYLERDEDMAYKNGSYLHGDILTLEDVYDYQYWIKYSDFAFKPEDAEFASSVDYYFVHDAQELSEYDMEENSSRYENCFNYTLFYVLNPTMGVEEMEKSVFMR